MKKFVALVITSLLSLFAASARAEVSPWNCPAEIDGSPGKIRDEVQTFLDRKELEGALELATDCATFGSSLDVSIIMPVLDAYDAVLPSLLTRVQKQTFDEMNKRCENKYANQGTLGLSMAAHCQAHVYQAFESVFSPNEE